MTTVLGDLIVTVHKSSKAHCSKPDDDSALFEDQQPREEILQKEKEKTAEVKAVLQYCLTDIKERRFISSTNS